LQHIGLKTLIILVSLASLPPLAAGARAITLSQNVDQVQTYDFVELTLRVAQPDVANPFAEVDVTGRFSKSGRPQKRIIGFCDSDDGSVFKIRFMPSEPGEHSYTLTYREASGLKRESKNSFRSNKSLKKGIVRAATNHPLHFTC